MSESPGGTRRRGTHEDVQSSGLRGGTRRWACRERVRRVGEHDNRGTNDDHVDNHNCSPDDNVVDNNSGKSIGGQITLTPNKEFSLTTGYLGGPEQDDNTTDWRHLWDTNFTYAASKEVSLAADYVYGQEAQGTKTYKWTGVTGYLQYTPNDMFSITPATRRFPRRAMSAARAATFWAARSWEAKAIESRPVLVMSGKA